MKQDATSIEHHDCRQMAAALEGLAGSLQAGYHVDAKDLHEASEMAVWVWEAGPVIPNGRQGLFMEARRNLESNVAACAQGQPREAGIVERAALRMAREFRFLAAETRKHEARKELPKAVDERIHDLVRKYGRHAAA